MIPLFPVVWFTFKVAVLKTTVLSGFRLVENGFHGQATLGDLKRDKAFLSAIGTDTAKLVLALTRLATSRDLGSVIKAAHAINNALEYLPIKTRAGLDKSVGLEYIVEAALKHALVRTGQSLLQADVPEKSLTEALTRIYFGLFLVGRGYGRLTQSDLRAVIMTLQSIHALRNTNIDNEVKSILQIWVPEKSIPLSKALVQLREAFILSELAAPDMFTVYITSALGGNVAAVNEPSLLTDLTTRFSQP